MRLPPWRLALAAALACLLPAFLSATAPAEATPASRASFTTESAESSPVGASFSPTPAPGQPNPSPTNSPSPVRPPAPDFDYMGRAVGYLALFAALAGGALYFMKFGLPLLKRGAAPERRLHILETRPLGNRQYLLVVAYEDTRMLLGITPGKIDYLCPLDSSAAPPDFGSMIGAVENKSSRS